MGGAERDNSGGDDGGEGYVWWDFLFLIQDMPHLAGVSLWPGSESNKPIILQVTSTKATRQKIVQLVPYIIIAGRLTTEPVKKNYN